MKKIKLYRFTIKHTEYLPEHLKPDIITYHQTEWDSVTLIPGIDREIVKIEEKEIEIADNCLRRKNESTIRI